MPNIPSGYALGGVQFFSTVDWPDHIAATVFVKGCPWRCSYCHNTHLLTSTPSPDDVSWLTVVEKLRERSGFLDAVVFSGGEPLASPYLAEMAQTVKDMGYLVGLHTNGAEPAKFHDLLHLKSGLIDWVGLDIKAPASHYDEITHIKGSGSAAQSSLTILKDARIDYELRTTLYPEIFDREALFTLAEELLSLEEKSWVLQKYREAESSREVAPSFDLEAARKHLQLQGFKTLIIR